MADPANRPRSRRQLLRTAALTASGLLLAACASPLARPTARTNSKVDLVYQDWSTDWFPSLAQQMLEQFHATHPNIRVFYTPDPASEVFDEKMLATFQAGTAPDVFQGCCQTFPAWAQKGYALDLRPYVAATVDQATIADWDPAQYKALFLGDGRQFGVPKYHGALALYFNKDLLDERGVAYPDSNWDQDTYLAAMRLATADRKHSGQTDVWGSFLDVSWERIQIHVNGWGGHFVDPGNPTLCRMAEPEALDAMRWIQARMWQDNVMATVQNVQRLGTRQAFVDERVAMVEDGSWALKDVMSGANFRVGIAPMPAGPKRRATLTTTDGFGVYS